MSLKRSTIGRIAQGTLTAAVALLLGNAAPALADDRELLRDSVSDPYVFILLDTSGSMNWSPKCTQAQFNAGECDVVCPTGDCFVPLNGDDPSSKFYQAKEALHEVIQDTDDVQFGFATYNQDAAYMRAKHWMYKARTNGPTITGFGAFPAIGTQEVLGLDWPCTSGSNEGCAWGTPADTNDPWEMERIRRLPKGGISLGTNVTVYVRVASSGTRYRVLYDPISGTLGASVRFNIDIDRCNNSDCSNVTDFANGNVDFDYVAEFASWDNGDDRANPQLGYFGQGDAADPNAGNTCSGWDPNAPTGPPVEASTTDRYAGLYSIRFPTVADPFGRGSFFTSGDVIPLDWKDDHDHQQDILNRLAPNLVDDDSATPDFRTMSYFKNTRNAGESFLRLKDEDLRPLIPSGSTPLGNSVRAFRQWWAGCTSATCPPGGWEKVAAAQDPDFSCRRKFLLVLTDGDETCSGDPCGWTKTLFQQEGIKTFVVAFGIDNVAGNKLNCMASNGGSGAPIYPQNKEELVEALTQIFTQIREEASAFASAAVPSVQAEVADRIFLSSFTPLNGEPVWDGHLDAYLKPLPLTEDGKPDRDRTCPSVGSGQPRASCHLWDAGEELVTQAPEMDDMDNSATLPPSLLKLGMSPTERRVFYSKVPPANGINHTLTLFAPPQTPPSLTDPAWLDIWDALKISIDPMNLGAAKDETEEIVKETLAIKDSEIQRSDGTILPIRYVLGDIFHSDPAIIDRPSDFSFYSSDVFGTGAATCTNNPGYRCFADRHQRRRKMLVVGSDDGQLHFFEAGIYDSSAKKFSDGTGKELFSYIPRLMMPVIRDLAERSRQIYGIDSTPRIDEVFLDPKHTGTPTASEREWRTLVIGGFREGGKIDANGGFVDDFVSGYYALDITQPDQLKPDKSPIDTRVVPSCLTTNNTVPAGCGTLPFPAVLWEFTDSVSGSRWDEDDTNSNGTPDGNLEPDLGQTWSVPTVGRIRVVEGGVQTYKFVAIFGGGYDPHNKSAPKSGNWLYMVDVETGQAIYKRQLLGAVPSDPAVLDVDLDGYLDTIYIGTTAGHLYKVDISTAATLQTVTLSRNLTIPKLSFDPQVKRISGWNPFRIFDTGGRPIHFAPTVFYVAKLSRFALGFGTGDREDLWSETGVEGRFYMIVDDNFNVTTTGLPFNETKYPGMNFDSADQPLTTDFVLNPAANMQRGWYLRLPADDRVITQTFGLSGVVIFSSYQPKIEISGGGVCARGGDSNIFVVYANNGNAIMAEVDPDTGLKQKSRYRTVPEFVTNPYVERGATKNEGDLSEDNSEKLSDMQQEIMETLKKFCPPESKFANYWISVSGIRSDTGYERYATIPICIVQRNWKEQQ